MSRNDRVLSRILSPLMPLDDTHSRTGTERPGQLKATSGFGWSSFSRGGAQIGIRAAKCRLRAWVVQGAPWCTRTWVSLAWIRLASYVVVAKVLLADPADPPGLLA